MRLRDFVDLKKIQDIQDQFSAATGLAAIAVDAEGNYITEGSNFTDFCMKYTRGSQEGLRRCVKCDTECTGTYFCHAGLMDFASPILVNGERVGAVIGGQVLPRPPDEDEFRAIARELGVREDEYIAALRKVPIRSEKTIRSAALLLDTVVNELVNLEYLRNVNQHKMEVFDSEVSKAVSSIRDVKSKVADLRQSASMERLLAINASIEASRAGQAGVSFAVVAREMGELADKSTRVYAEIEEQVKTIEKSVVNMSKSGL